MKYNFKHQILDIYKKAVNPKKGVRIFIWVIVPLFAVFVLCIFLVPIVRERLGIGNPDLPSQIDQGNEVESGQESEVEISQGNEAESEQEPEIEIDQEQKTIELVYIESIPGVNGSDYYLFKSSNSNNYYKFKEEEYTEDSIRLFSNLPYLISYYNDRVITGENIEYAGIKIKSTHLLSEIISIKECTSTKECKLYTEKDRENYTVRIPTDTIRVVKIDVETEVGANYNTTGNDAFFWDGDFELKVSSLPESYGFGIDETNSFNPEDRVILNINWINVKSIYRFKAPNDIAYNGSPKTYSYLTSFERNENVKPCGIDDYFTSEVSNHRYCVSGGIVLPSSTNPHVILGIECKLKNNSGLTKCDRLLQDMIIRVM